MTPSIHQVIETEQKTPVFDGGKAFLAGYATT
jgi:hypothetical protein